MIDSNFKLESQKIEIENGKPQKRKKTPTENNDASPKNIQRKFVIRKNSLNVETQKIDIETERPAKQKKIATESDDAPQKNKKRKRVIKSVSFGSSNKLAFESKIFAIYEKRAMIEPLRNELVTRGWTEKVIEDDEDSTTPPQFVWLSRSNGVIIEGSPIVNRLRMEPLKNFCFKDILIDYGRQVNNDKKMELNVPRTFKLFSNERKEFIENYRLTAYCSFIRFVHATGSKTFSEKGTINSNWINFAIEKLEDAIASNDGKRSKKKPDPPKEKQDEETSDVNEKCKANISSAKEKEQKDKSDFEKFKKIYQSVVKFNSKIAADSTERKIFLKQCDVIYDKCKKAWKDFEKDGFYNLWLLKPARRSLGIGIKLFDEDVDILCYAKDNFDMKYLVQKYVERPMLIYNTKFDLRQYFLIVHHSTGIRLWMYKMCYLKFSTKLYDPLDYKVSVHVTNTAVQRKYSIDKNRSRNIPLCNEWSSDRFLAYLSKENKLDLWYRKIYPAMKKNIIATVSAAVDSSTLQPNRFQLYGCDFVIDEFHDPILLEINGLPILTSVICAMCLQDLVKVVLDTRKNPQADTGHFENVWEKKL